MFFWDTVYIACAASIALNCTPCIWSGPTRTNKFVSLLLTVRIEGTLTAVLTFDEHVHLFLMVTYKQDGYDVMEQQKQERPTPHCWRLEIRKLSRKPVRLVCIRYTSITNTSGCRQINILKSCIEFGCPLCQAIDFQSTLRYAFYKQRIKLTKASLYATFNLLCEYWNDDDHSQ